MSDPYPPEAMIACRAIESGDSEKLAIYIQDALPKLLEITIGNEVSQGDLSYLTGLHVVLAKIQRALSSDASLDFKLALTRRTRGKPSYPRRRIDGQWAALYVARLVAEGMKQEAAIKSAMEKTGMSRSEVFAWLKSFRMMALDEFLLLDKPLQSK